MDLRPTDTEEVHDHDRGLAFDLGTIVQRRRMLGLLGVGGAAVVAAACGSSGTETSAGSAATGNGATTTTSATSTTAAASVTTAAGGPGGPPPGGGGPGRGETNVQVADGEIPEETAGPFPGDGSNGVNVLTESGIVRSDITSSFGSASGIAEGMPLSVELTVVDLSSGSTPVTGAAVYIWHCDRAGNYSMYSGDAVNENFLRGVQETDGDGKVSFKSIFPAAYSGRWPHIHIEVYPSVSDATSASSKLRTTQLALPKEACNQVYATSGYESSLRNMAQTSLDSDNVFSDGYSLQLAKVTGSTSKGYTAALNLPV